MGIRFPFVRVTNVSLAKQVFEDDDDEQDGQRHIHEPELALTSVATPKHKEENDGSEYSSTVQRYKNLPGDPLTKIVVVILEGITVDVFDDTTLVKKRTFSSITMIMIHLFDGNIVALFVKFEMN